VTRAILALRDHKDRKGSRGSRERSARWGRKVLRGHKALKDSKVYLVQLVHKASRGSRDPPGLRGPRETQVQPEQLGHKVHKANRVLRDPPGRAVGALLEVI
jgi:hypothetical protein